MLFVSRRQSGKNSIIQMAATEVLETRLLYCWDHETFVGPATLTNNLLPTDTTVINDHDSAWYLPDDVITLNNPLSAPQLKPLTDLSGLTNNSLATTNYSPVYPTVTSFPVNAAGLPLMSSHADGSGLEVFLDFDGFNADLPFSLDADNTTFNTTEQINIVETWRDIVSYFSPLNVNVTTVQPPTGGANPVFVWQRLSNSSPGGSAYVNWLTNDTSHGWNPPGDVTGRHSGIAHEIGHQLGLNHQSEYDKFGTKTSEYSDGYSNRDRPIIGVDYMDAVRGWFYGRDAVGPTNLVDDLAVMSNVVKGVVGGDGYLPDDYGGTTATAVAVPATGFLDAVIERISDIDVFSFTASAGTYLIDATPTFESAVSPKIELLDSSGNLIASRDDADQRGWNHNDQEFTIDLAAGNYFVKVSSSGDYGEQGEYLLTAAPLLTGWATQDIQQVFRPGTASYDPINNTLTQLGGGTDIWNTADQFRFTSQVLNGDGSITAKIDSLDNVDFYAKAGVMIRQSMASNSQHVYFGVRPDFQLETIKRNTAGATAVNIIDTAGQTGPWVRITRVGNNFTLAKSADGSSWTNITTTTVSMTGAVYIGFATSARRARMATWSKFSNISVTGNLGSAAATYNALATPTGLAAAPATGANTSVVLNWTDTASETGYAIDRSVDGVTFTQISTVGSNVTTYTDTNPYGSMRYYYRIAARDALSTRSVPSAWVSVINKPGAVANPSASYAPPFMSTATNAIQLNWTDVQGDAGYRIERSTDNVSFSFLVNRPANYNAYNDSGLVAGTVYYYRITPITTIGDTVTAPFTITAATRLAAVAGFAFTSKQSTSMAMSWTDLTNETGYRMEKSTDGTTWATAATLGAGVTSWTDNSVTATNEYYYRLVGLNSVTGFESINASMIMAAAPRSTILPINWADADIGTVAGTGTTSVSGNTWKMVSSGSDISGTTDSFRFAYVPMTTNTTLIARVDSLEATTTAAKAGLMIRQSLTANSPFAAIMINAGSTFGIDIRSRLTANAQYTYQQALASVLPPYYLKLVRTGNSVALSYSADGATYTTAATIALTTTGTFYVGLAATANSTTLLNTSNFSNVSVNAAFPSTINGTAGNDQFYIKRNGANIDFWFGDGTGLPFYTTAYASFPTLTTLQINGLGGDDTLIIDYSGGETVPTKGLAFDGGADNDTLVTRGSGVADPFTISSSSVVTHSSTSANRSNTETLKLQSGNFTVSANQGNINLQIDAAAANLTQTQNLNSLNLINGAIVTSASTNVLAPAMVIGSIAITDSTLNIAANGNLSGVSKFGSLSMAGTGRIDLHNNDLVIDYGINLNPYPGIINLVKSGLTLFSGNGNGIGSSDVDNQTQAGTVLAVVDNGSLGGQFTNLSGYSTFSANSILIKYTWFGDSDLSGVIDGGDYALADTGFTDPNSDGWLFGDYNYDGVVTGDDYSLLDTGYISQTAVL